MFDKTLNSADVYKHSTTCRKVRAHALVWRNIGWFHQHNKQLQLAHENKIFINHTGAKPIRNSIFRIKKILEFERSKDKQWQAVCRDWEMPNLRDFKIGLRCFLGLNSWLRLCFPSLDYCLNIFRNIFVYKVLREPFTGLLTSYLNFSPFTYKLGLIKTLINRTFKINNNTWMGFHTDLQK